MSSKVLTRFFLPMGATLIQGACMAGFARLESLDALPEIVKWAMSYVNIYWHTSCKRGN